jgi:hypothetical protein
MLYSDVKQRFKDRLNRRDCSDTLADGFLQDAITRIQRTLRVPAMEKSINVTLDNVTYFTANIGLPIPSDYLNVREITVDDKRELHKRDLTMILPLAAVGVGDPLYYGRRGNKWIFAPTPAAPFVDNAGVTHNVSVRVDYYAEFPPSINPTDDTILTDIAADLVIYGALSYACDHFNDKRGDRFEKRFSQIKDDIQGMADDDELAGSAQVQPAYLFPPDDLTVD